MPICAARLADRIVVLRGARRTIVVVAAALLAACGGGSGGAATPAPGCPPGSAFDGTQCRVFAVRTTERMATPWSENGRPLTLEMVVYRPLGAGPYPTLVFHHGSTGNGDDPTQFRVTATSETVARVFAEQGWMVLFPQRRGRGASDGLYDEGFEPDRSRYACTQALALTGLAHALEDAEAIYQHVRNRADVEASRVVVGGFSRGGILAMAHAAQRPTAYRGSLNFVGGWLGEVCPDAVAVNRTTFVSAATGPRRSLWLYGENDPFYSAAHSRANFDAFVGAGGAGIYRLYRRSSSTASGHLIINEPALWQAEVTAFIAAVR
jgi:dienelactone hydrolase